MNPVTIYKDVPIFVGRDLLFHAAPEEGIDLKAETATGIRQDIDAYQKARRDQQVVSLSVVTSWGHRGNITGIHMGTCALRGFSDLQTAPAAYPDVPWIVAAIADMAHHRAALGTLADNLKPYLINTSRGYGRLQHGRYAELMDQLVDDYRDKRERAEKVQP